MPFSKAAKGSRAWCPKGITHRKTRLPGCKWNRKYDMSVACRLTLEESAMKLDANLREEMVDGYSRLLILLALFSKLSHPIE